MYNIELFLVFIMPGILLLLMFVSMKAYSRHYSTLYGEHGKLEHKDFTEHAMRLPNRALIFTTILTLHFWLIFKWWSILIMLGLLTIIALIVWSIHGYIVSNANNIIFKNLRLDAFHLGVIYKLWILLIFSLNITDSLVFFNW